MIGFTLRRLLQAIIVILGVVFIVFILSKQIPGGVASIALGPRRTPAEVARFNLANGYDLPLWDQFYQYVRGLFTLDLGYSYPHNEGVEELIAQRLPKT